MMAFIDQEANEKAEEIDAKVSQLCTPDLSWIPTPPADKFCACSKSSRYS